GLSSIFSQQPYLVPARELGILLGAPYAGAAVGAPLFGWLAARRGPVRTMADCTLWLTATSLLAAVSSVPGELTIARFLAGISLGGYPPLMIAYLVDAVPTRARAKLMFIAF